MTTHARPQPVGGPLLDRTMITLLGLFSVAEAVIGYRFLAGIGAVSNMNDGYTWGIWEPVNVVVFTGIGAGAYAVGLLCYLLNRGQYHPLVRPAVLLGAIAYTLGGASIVIAVGRPWNIYLLGLPSLWNFSSVLLEVALCVTVYVCVLWIEMLPPVLEQGASGSDPRAAFWARCGERLAKAMPYIIALALLLPTMHQSSLGGLMLIAGSKLHPLWQTALLPMLALISCLSMGLGTVVVLTALMKHSWNARQDQAVLAQMSRVNAVMLLAFALVRIGDLAFQGRLPLLLADGAYVALFCVELALFIGPAVLFLSPLVENGRLRVTGALLSVVGAALWRIDCFLTCYDPGAAFRYRPAFGEVAVTVGMAAIGVAVFIGVSKRFPVVVHETPAVPASLAMFVLGMPEEQKPADAVGEKQPADTAAEADEAARASGDRT